ncbi:DNA-directed RNA polymerase subunit alpha C-terminal domain-containing protein [Arthrobacter sp. ISL-48]|uniref:DNA-directed RNA polymerase subunit alpha C-terminal domain-containing protein n=1 Tax=Arthrobacter sp. ISL-48 TaxID=2819110 RepID=UPI0037BF4652
MDLGLSTRGRNALLRHGIRTVGQLITRSRDDLVHEIFGLGTRAVTEIEAALYREGLGLAAERGPQRYRGTYSANTSRHTKNHYLWLTPPVTEEESKQAAASEAATRSPA